MSGRQPPGAATVPPLSARPAAVPAQALRRALLGAVSALLLAAAPAQAAEPVPAASAARPSAPQLLDFSADERARILAHGPWPLPAARDPGNRLSGRPAAVALGRTLFFDPRLSPDGRLACASCHVPALGWADGRPRGQGREPLDRHTPSLWNTGQQRWWGWDGAFDSLWSQALQPLLNPLELASDAAHLRRLLATDPRLARAARSAGIQANAEDERLLADLAKALGAFVATIATGPTPFDQFRSALARGDAESAARYPVEAQRGLRLFIGRGQCSSCHAGPLFSNGEFADIGRPFFIRPGVVDRGRLGGIEALLASRFNLLGRHSDAPGGADDAVATKTRHVLAQHRNFGEFKVPSLRGVAQTAPYMHDGSLATLADVVQHYSSVSPDRLHADGEQLVKALNLSAQEATDLEAFLRSLSPRGGLSGNPGSARAPAGRSGSASAGR